MVHFLNLLVLQQFHFSKTQVQITLVLLHINGMRLVLDLSLKGSNTLGTATVLSLSNLVSPTDNNRSSSSKLDYVGNDVTGNATNEPLQSNEVTVTVFPDIEIVGQPTDAFSTIVNTNVSFTVNASLTDEARPVRGIVISVVS